MYLIKKKKRRKKKTEKEDKNKYTNSVNKINIIYTYV